MEHRHLNHQRFTLAAIDDVIARGKWQDWADLRQAALANPTVLENIRRVCAARLAGVREGPAPRMEEPSAGVREGPAHRMEEPSAGEREGLAPRMKEPYPQRHHFWMHWTQRHAQTDDTDAPAS